MKIKIGQIANARSGMAWLSSSRFPPTTSIKIFRIMRVIKPELDDYLKVENELIRKYGVEIGDQVSVPINRIDEFVNELKPVQDEEIEIDFTPLPVSLLTIDMSADQLDQLSFMLNLEA